MIDWGTTSLRAYLLDSSGAVLGESCSQQGITQVKQEELKGVLLKVLDGWKCSEVLICGMAGSKQALLEVPYVQVPAGEAALAAGCGTLALPGLRVRIVPGVMIPAEDGQAEDVMRGEEVQLLGCKVGGSGTPGSTQLVLLPGTHTKWALLQDGKLLRFWTMMTGEVFACLRQHSILGKLMVELDAKGGVASDGVAASSAFLRGVDYGKSAPGGLLHLIFSARTLGLFQKLQPAELPSYLSGILHACEVREALALPGVRSAARDATVVLLGSPAHCERYAITLRDFGYSANAAGDTALAGLRIIARALRLIGVVGEEVESERASKRARLSVPCELEEAMSKKVPATVSTPLGRFREAMSLMPLVAILRGIKPAQAAEVGLRLVQAGVRVIEVPLNSPEPMKSIRALCDAVSNRAVVGAGTVLTVEQVDEVAAAGGVLIVSPNTDEALIRRTVERGLVSVPGFCTPTEAFVALRAGAHALKLFPGNAALLKATKAVLPPETEVIVVGGVDTSGQSMEPFLRAGAGGFGMGSALFTPGMTTEEVGAKAVAAVHGLVQAMCAATGLSSDGDGKQR